jgi:hypothetical protein
VDIADLAIRDLLASFEKNALPGLERFVKMNSPSTAELGDNDYISVSTGRAFLAKVSAVLATVTKAADDIAIDLETRTAPEAGANITLSTGSGLTQRQTTSNVIFKNLFRGVYDVSVTQDSYKPFEGRASIDLVDFTPKRLICSMASTKSRAQSECHLE